MFGDRFYYHRMPMFAPDGGGAGAGDGAGSGSEGDNKGAGGGEEKKFTQAELDTKIQERISRESKKYDKYKDLDDKELESYKAWKKEQDEKAENEKTDLQKEKDAREAAEKEKKVALEKANQRLIRAAFLVSAKDIPEDRRDAAYKLADISAVTVNDNGDVDEKLLKTAIDEVLKANPFLKGTTEKQNVGGGAGDGGGKLTNEDIAKKKAEERNKKMPDHKFWS